MSGITHTTALQRMSYIEHMLIELRKMSEKESAPVLAYLIEMAIIEARDLCDTLQSGALPDAKQPPKLRQISN